MKKPNEIECPKRSDDCKKIVENMLRALDGELSFEEEKKILKIIKECPECFQKFNVEKNFKEFLKKKVEKKNVQQALLASIKQRIENNLL